MNPLITYLNRNFWKGAFLGVILSASLPSQAYQNCEKVAVAQPGAANNNSKSFSGNISWYGIPFHGKKTASGEIFNMYKLSAAHKKLPFFTRVMVEDPKTGKTVIVKVNDRGPFVKTRVMDLSREGARQLGTINKGVTFADCLVLDETGKSSND